MVCEPSSCVTETDEQPAKRITDKSNNRKNFFICISERDSPVKPWNDNKVEPENDNIVEHENDIKVKSWNDNKGKPWHDNKVEPWNDIFVLSGLTGQSINF